MAMMAKQYYYLIASLTEYSMDSETKGFDATELREMICENLSESDRELVKMLYYYYDIENIINLKSGRAKFNSLGNFSPEQLEENMASLEELPGFISKVLMAYKDPDNVDGDDIDPSLSIEKSLYTSYYNECLKSKNKFVREYAEFDLNLRNVSAAVTARSLSLEVSKVVVADNFVSQCLSKNTSSDFGLKGEVDYLDTVLSAATNNDDLVGKEKQIDALRWKYIDDMVTFDYFSVNYVLCYLVKLSMIQRWKDLNSDAGRAVFKELLGKLVDNSLAENA